MPDLITVPTFTFNQGDQFEGAEQPIQVCYYNNQEGKPLIELNQDGRYINFTSIDELQELVKEIKRHHSEADKYLSK